MKSGILQAGVALILCGVAAHVHSQAHAQDAHYGDDEVKAAFIYHFATFVEWPEAGRSDEIFTIAVLGADAIAAELERILPGRAIQGRPMNVRRLRTIDDLEDEAVLFIGTRRDSRRLAGLLEKASDKPVLLVTDAPGALRYGSMINFRIVDRRVRFEISLTAAERAGLALSSRLLSAALLVDTTGAVLRPGPANPSHRAASVAPPGAFAQILAGAFSTSLERRNLRGLTERPIDASFTFRASYLPATKYSPRRKFRARMQGSLQEYERSET